MEQLPDRKNDKQNFQPIFIPLRLYSDYSLGQSNIKIKDLINHCKYLNIPAVALTDLNNLFGALEFATECATNGIQPIPGATIRIANRDLYEIENSNNSDITPTTSELIVLAKNETGYKNLLCLVSELNLRNEEFFYHDIFPYLNNLILLVGPNSNIANHCQKNRTDLAKVELHNLQKAGGEVFLELHRYPDNRHQQLEPLMLHLAQLSNIPIVATNPTQFLSPNLHLSCDALSCILGGRYLNEDNRPRIDLDHYLKSTQEMVALFSDLPEAIENTVLIAQKCSFMPEKSPPLLPKFDVNILDEDALLEEYATRGLADRIKHITTQENAKKYWDRLDFERSVIKKMGFSGYFLIVSDFVLWSKQNDIPVGPGRGSGAGSVVAWSLGITELDPLEFGLLFERFLNPERISMPDFDIDFCQSRRDEVINYVRQKYGSDRVASIITFGKLQARAVLRDVGRVLSMPYSLVDRICKMVPNNPANPVTLQQAINLDKNLQNMRDTEPDIAELLRISLQLEGVHRHVSTHAAGIVISDRPIVELVPLYKTPDTDLPVVQYSMKYTEAAGLMKFDFLGLKTLTVLNQACHLIAEGAQNSANDNSADDNKLAEYDNITNYDQQKKYLASYYDLYSLNLTDSETYKMLSKGKTIGVFQFEGIGMREAIKKLRPDAITDLIALTSLYRPGPMDNIPHYINRKHGIEEADYIYPTLENILRETYGIIVYQEQVTQIAQVLAGYSLGEADLVRRAMGKKNKAEMEAQQEIFVRRAVENGLEKQKATEIFALVDKFASYGFNKAHAASYSVLSYYTAYLKMHYPHEFFAASINLEIDDSDKISMFCTDVRQFGIKIVPPSINISDVYFKVGNYYSSDLKEKLTPDSQHDQKTETKIIYFGLGGIRNAGTQVIQSIITERNTNGNFLDIFDFAKRTVPLGLNRRLLETLARSGALKSLHSNTAEIIANSELILQYGQEYKFRIQAQTKQIGLFDFLASDNIIDNPNLKPAPIWTFSENLDAEYIAFGFYFNDHPLNPYSNKMEEAGIIESELIGQYAKNNGATFKVAGVVTSCKIRSGKGARANKYAFVQIADQYGNIDFAIFKEELLNQSINLLKEGTLIVVQITARVDDGGTRLVAESIVALQDAFGDVILRYEVIIKNSDGLKIIKEMQDNLKQLLPSDKSSKQDLCLLILKVVVEIKSDLEFETGIAKNFVVTFVTPEPILVSQQNFHQLEAMTQYFTIIRNK